MSSDSVHPCLSFSVSLLTPLSLGFLIYKRPVVINHILWSGEDYLRLFHLLEHNDQHTIVDQ